MALLGVNIDHVATLREARKGREPDPVWAAVQAELGGADGITVHLREDRRHIQDRDLRVLRETIAIPLNLEMAATDEMTRIALEVKPDQVTLVPEKREEVTTEGGLDAVTHYESLRQCVDQLQQAGIRVSLFLDADVQQIARAVDMGAAAVELHTGQYALATGAAVEAEMWKLAKGAEQIRSAGLVLNAGHGLNYHNVQPVARLDAMHELNIGHSIVARGVMAGLAEATRTMKLLITAASH